MELDPLWDELFPAEQARIVQLLVERVDVGHARRRGPPARRTGSPGWCARSAAPAGGPLRNG